MNQGEIVAVCTSLGKGERKTDVGQGSQTLAPCPASASENRPMAPNT
jgi:hypothetical protein